MDFAGKIHQSIMKSIFEIKPKPKPNKELSAILSNFPYSFKEFCLKYVKIAPKTGGLIPFQFNESQEKWFAFLIRNYEKNKKQKISFLTIKFRQNGISTIASSFCFYAGLCNGYNVAFTGKDQTNVVNLFNMVERLYKNSGLEEIFSEGKRHANRFMEIGSMYFYFAVASGSGTRGLTVGCLMPDEMGERNDDMDLEALSPIKNNIYLPFGTPKGVNNLLYNAYKGTPEEDILFLAWHEFEENKQEFDGVIIPEVVEYLKKFNLTYLNITQQAWIQDKYLKIKTRSFNPENTLNQEYPPNIKIGFEMTADNCFCDPNIINLAFENKQIPNSSNQIIIGIDVGGGKDKTIVCFRREYEAEFVELKHDPNAYDHYETKIYNFINILLKNPSFYITAINIDSSGQMGIDFVNKMKHIFRDREINISINGVFFGSKVEIETYKLEKRKMGIKEFMYFELRKWLKTRNVKLENLQVLKEELLATQITTRNGEEFLLTKEEVKKNLGHSPDYADALALTFAPNADSIISFTTHTFGAR